MPQKFLWWGSGVWGVWGGDGGCGGVGSTQLCGNTNFVLGWSWAVTTFSYVRLCTIFRCKKLQFIQSFIIIDSYFLSIPNHNFLISSSFLATSWFTASSASMCSSVTSACDFLASALRGWQRSQAFGLFNCWCICLLASGIFMCMAAIKTQHVKKPMHFHKRLTRLIWTTTSLYHNKRKFNFKHQPKTIQSNSQWLWHHSG